MQRQRPSGEGTLNHLDLSGSLSPGLLLLVTQQTTQDLSTGILWNRIHKANTALQPLVPSLMILNVFLNRFSRGFVGTGGG